LTFWAEKSIFPE